MALKTKWIEMIYNLATSSRKIRSFFTPLGVLIFFLFVFSFVIIALQVDKLLGITELFSRQLSLILASLFLLVALILVGWSVFTFLKAKGTPVPLNPPPRLVTSGPYAYVRNPMLTGVFALLFGLGVLLESFSLVVIFTPLFILVSVWELKTIEEPELLKRLGQDYAEYRKSTPMFFPGFGTLFKRRK